MNSTKDGAWTETQQARRQTKTLFGLAAALSLIVSVGLWFTGEKQGGLYVGLWVPSILAAGAFLLVGEDH